MSRSGLAAVAVMILGALLLLALQDQPPLSFSLGGDVRPTVPQSAVVLLAAVTGLMLGIAAGGRRRRRPRGHDPRMLLPRLLSKRVRRAIDQAYEEGSLEQALELVLKEREKDAFNLGLHYWAIRLELESGRAAEARGELTKLLPRLPEVALTIRWSALFEAAGEQDLWVRDVLERIRSGRVVRRSTFRELVRLLEKAGRFDEGLEVLQRLREIDPPTPEEEEDLSHTEMVLRVRQAEVLVEEGKGEEAMAAVRTVRERYSGWRSPYRVGFRALTSMDRGSEAVDWMLEGFRNSGDPDLLLIAYDRPQAGDPVALLESWDDKLSDLVDDGWYLVTTGWIALRHALVEEGVDRLRRVGPEEPAHAHAQALLGGLDASRGHSRPAAAALSEAAWSWIELPYLWRCAVCGTLARHAEFVCGTCGSWESYGMLRPYGQGEAATRSLGGRQLRPV